MWRAGKNPWCKGSKIITSEIIFTLISLLVIWEFVSCLYNLILGEDSHAASLQRSHSKLELRLHNKGPNVKRPKRSGSFKHFLRGEINFKIGNWGPIYWHAFYRHRSFWGCTPWIGISCFFNKPYKVWVKKTRHTQNWPLV